MQLELKDIGKKFQQQWLFRHIDFSMSSGESLSVTGRNGAGKSTLIQIVYGLVQQSEGQVLIDGNSDFKASKIFSYTSPSMALPSEFTLLEIFDLYVKMGKITIDLESFLAFSEFNSIQARKMVKLFSSGMMQRLKTALCLSTSASIVLLDEPLTNMDIQGEKWYKNCVQNRSSSLLIIAGNNPTEYEFTKFNINLSPQ
ncbi:MAG: ATP-binding cassette domain-containing protein [Bacteroidia bacterium]